LYDLRSVKVCEVEACGGVLWIIKKQD
jgi:hypothetical protein